MKFLRILNSEKAQSFQEIKKQYFKIVKQEHPDIKKGKDGDNPKINIILDAYRELEGLHKLNPENFEKILKGSMGSGRAYDTSFNPDDVNLYDKVRKDVDEAYGRIFRAKMDSNFNEYKDGSEGQKDAFDLEMRLIQRKHMIMKSEMAYLFSVYFDYLADRQAEKNEKKWSDDQNTASGYGMDEVGSMFYRMLKVFKILLGCGVALAVGLFLPEKLLEASKWAGDEIERKKKRLIFEQRYKVPSLESCKYEPSTKFVLSKKDSEKDAEFFKLTLVERIKKGINSKHLWGDKDKRERVCGLDESEYLVHSTIRKDISLSAGKTSPYSIPQGSYKKHTKEELEKFSLHGVDDKGLHLFANIMQAGTKANLSCVHVQVCEEAQEALKHAMVYWDDVRYQIETKGYYDAPAVFKQFKGNFSITVRRDKQMNLDMVSKPKISLYDLFFDYGVKIFDNEQRHLFKVIHIYPPFINEPTLFKVSEKGPYHKRILSKSANYFKHSNKDGVLDYARILREEIYEDVFSKVHRADISSFEGEKGNERYTPLQIKFENRRLHRDRYCDSILTLQDRVPQLERSLDPMVYFKQYGLKNLPPFFRRGANGRSNVKVDLG